MFDPLHKWLGIPPHEQPPDHYRLLGLKRFESDNEVIDFAADRHLSYLRRFDNSEFAEQATEVANQVSQARVCLVDSEKRARYDAELQSGSSKPRDAAHEKLRDASPDTPENAPSNSPKNTPHVAPVIRTDDLDSRSSKRSSARSSRRARRSDSAASMAQMPVASPGQSNPTEGSFISVDALDREHGRGHSRGHSREHDLEHGRELGRKHDRELCRKHDREANSFGKASDTDFVPRIQAIFQRHRLLLSVGLTAVGCLMLGTIAGRLFWPRKSFDAASEIETSNSVADSEATGNREATGAADANGKSPTQSAWDLRRRGFEKSGIPSVASTESVRKELANRFPPDKLLVFQPSRRPTDSQTPPTPDLAATKQQATEKRAAQKQAVKQAEELYEIGLESSSNSRLRFSAWSLAANRYLEAGEYRYSMQVIADMDAAFHDFDLLGKQGTVLAFAAQRISTQQVPGYMDDVVRFLESCIQAERFDLSKEYGRKIERSLAGLRPRPRLDQLGQVLARSHFEERWYREYQDATRELATTPRNPEANLLVGEYLAVARGRWRESLPYLLESSDETMRKAAQAEMARMNQQGTALQVADAWSEAARGKGRRRNRASLMLRAYDWYRIVLLDAPLEDRLHAEQQIQGYQVMIPELVNEDRPMLDESS